jgi:antibiotic biosynthesis monooxygenase (ABM) superfamily enzyme
VNPSSQVPQIQMIQAHTLQDRRFTAPPQPTRWKMTLLIWMMVYPTITGLGLALNPVLKDRPLLVRNFVITAIFVPFMVYGAVPVARKIVIELDAKQKS